MNVMDRGGVGSDKAYPWLAGGCVIVSILAVLRDGNLSVSLLARNNAADPISTRARARALGQHLTLHEVFLIL